MTRESVSKKVVFVSHSSARTGAPLLLLDLLCKIHENCNDYDLHVLCHSDGELLVEFSKVATTHLYHFAEPSKERQLVRRMTRALGRKLGAPNPSSLRSYRRTLLNRLRKEHFELIYSNTAVNGEILNFLSDLDLPVITHVHELDTVIAESGKSNWKQIATNTTRYIAASNAVRSFLIRNMHVVPSDIDVVYEYVDYNKISDQFKGREHNLGLEFADNDFVVCGCGVSEWRKGTHIFLLLAKTIIDRRPDANIAFMWVGGWSNDIFEIQTRIILERLQLGSHVQFVGSVDNPLDYFARSDLFLLTSLEDPFPIVCLEAAALGKPVICFDQAGGMPEFVRDDAGFVVPFLDVGAMADRVLELYDDREKASQMGECGRRRVEKNHTVEVAANKILHIMETTISGGEP